MGRQVTSSEHFKQVVVHVDILLIWDSLDKRIYCVNILCETLGKVAISAAKYVQDYVTWITGVGDTAIEVCEIIFLSRPRI